MGMATIQGAGSDGTLTGRTTLGWRFDRNCVLAGAAGRILTAIAIGVNIEAIVVGESELEVGPVAKDIEFGQPPLLLVQKLVIGAGSVLGFGYAAGLPYDDIVFGVDEEQRRSFETANAIVAPAIADQTMYRLVRRLDRMAMPGKYRSLEWLTALTN